MITIDLQDDEITRAKKNSPRGKDSRRESVRRLDRTSITGEQTQSLMVKPGLFARLIKRIFKES